MRLWEGLIMKSNGGREKKDAKTEKDWGERKGILILLLVTTLLSLGLYVKQRWQGIKFDMRDLLGEETIIIEK
jgi:hypothetical protein